MLCNAHTKMGYVHTHCTQTDPLIHAHHYLRHCVFNSFPNMTEFVAWEHARGLKAFFNDHPFPVGPQTSPEEVQFRWDGLTSVMRDIGIDWWW